MQAGGSINGLKAEESSLSAIVTGVSFPSDVFLCDAEDCELDLPGPGPTPSACVNATVDIKAQPELVMTARFQCQCTNALDRPAGHAEEWILPWINQGSADCNF